LKHPSATLMKTAFLAISSLIPISLSAHEGVHDVREYDKKMGFGKIDFTKGLGTVPWLNDLVVESRPQPAQGLGGRLVFLSPGHGRTFNETTLVWGWQRNTVGYGEKEDLITPRISNRWVAEYFENAGANVISSRERDEQLNEFILDDSNTPNITMTGNWEFVTPTDAKQSTAMRALANSGAEFTWYATIPEKDQYGLCFWFPAQADADTSATLIIHTAAGDVEAKISQQRNTARWYWIDQFVFPEGNVPIATLVADSATSGTYVYADGIRLGGGMGDYNGGAGTSGLPRWQEYSKSWAIKYGAPSSVWNQFVTGSDFGIRRSFAFWTGADIFLELHSNADATGGGTQTGTLTFWSISNNDQQRQQFQNFHNEMIVDLRSRWLSNWRDAGFLNDDVTGTSLPSNLIEMAFHDRNSPDLDSLVDPDFRRIIARSIYEGAVPIIRGDDLGVFLPEPPEGFAAQNKGNGEVLLSWDASAFGPAPDSYTVYKSTDGIAFDLGQPVGNVTNTTLAGYQPGDEVFFQLRATNAGGRSFPTETLGVRVGDNSESTMLIINGFDRLDRLVQEPDNPRNFVIQHLQAFGKADPTIAIDSAANEALVDGQIAIDEYDHLNWILGVEHLDDKTLSPFEQELLYNFILNPNSIFPEKKRTLFISGANIADDLVTNSKTEWALSDADFANQVLNIHSSGQRTAEKTATGVSGDFFDGLSFTLSGLDQKPYNVMGADVYEESLFGRTVLEWQTGGSAAIAYGNGPHKVLTSAVPLEAVKDQTEREEYAAAVLGFLQAPVEVDTTAPVISNIQVTPIGQDFAVVSFETDEASTFSIRWGLAGQPLDQADSSSTLAFEHSYRIEGLQTQTEYDFQLTVEDNFENSRVGNVTSFTTASPDTTPPVISNLQVQTVTDRDVILYFTTDEPAVSGIDSSSVPAINFERLDTGYVDEHFLLARNLQANTNTNITVSATDAQNNQSTQQITFTTLSPINDLIVDNLDAGFSVVGSWSTGTFGVPYNGNYRFSSINTTQVTQTANWAVVIPMTGNYRLYTRYSSGGNRSPLARYTTVTPQGNQLVQINQQASGDQWVQVIPSIEYPEGFQTAVTLDNFSATGNVVIADAVRWQFLGTARIPVPIPMEDRWIFE
jgi:N-acetylmuramoyl-L-alanine amidase